MNIEELRAEAEKLGYKLTKIPKYNCVCLCNYEERINPNHQHYCKYCKNAVFIERTKYYTHCYRVKRSRKK